MHIYSTLTVFECWINDGAKECRHNNDRIKPMTERENDGIKIIWAHTDEVIRTGEPFKMWKELKKC